MSVSADRSSRPQHDELGARNLLRPALLLLLHESESHGYALRDRLAEVGMGVPTAAGLYRTLQTMEEGGFLRSYWTTPDRGPARRIFAITEAGGARLERDRVALASLLRTVQRMLNRYRKGS